SGSGTELFKSNSHYSTSDALALVAVATVFRQGLPSGAGFLTLILVAVATDLLFWVRFWAEIDSFLLYFGLVLVAVATVFGASLGLKCTLCTFI
ncbi:MAG: hypothetical protein ACJ763_13790, partial [Bdellovibrionia bacterium]